MSEILKKLRLIKHISRRDHLVYWGIPFTITFVFLVMFCFGPFWMKQFVSPAINREYGALENIAIIMLGLVVYFAIKCFLKAHTVFDKIIFGFVVLIASFLFLEEIDYGLHYYEMFRGIVEADKAVVRNIHNTYPGLLVLMKVFIYIFIVVVFVLLPLVGEKPFPKVFRLYIASPKIIYTVASLQVISSVAFFFIYDLGYHGNDSLDHNVTEFGEGIIYYMIFLYMTEIYGKLKKLPGSNAGVIAGSGV